MEKQASLRRTLTLGPLVVIGLAYMDPLVVFDSYGVVSKLTEGHVPIAYILTLVALLFTALSYGKMVQVYPSAGSTYTYAQKSIHPHVGFLVGWSVMLDYLFLPMVNFAIGSAYLTAAFPAIPGPVWVLILAVMITIINLFGIKLTANMSALFVTFQTLVALVFVGFMIKGISGGMGEGTLISSAPFFTSDMNVGLVFSGASILCFSFLGFDAVTTLSEETVNPKKNIPRAILAIAFTGGILFTGISYLLHMVHPNFLAFQDVDAASLEVASYVGGSFMHSLFLAGTMVAVISSSLSSHTSASRLLYAMGREGALPKRIFGYVSAKRGTPVFNIIIIGAISMTAVFGELEVIYSFISFGALIGFLFVNLSVIAHYYIREKRRSGLDFVRYFLAPAIGGVFCVWLFVSLNISALLVGSAWLVLGGLYLYFKLKQNPSLEFNFTK
ncbi:APC family permease [Paenibacillus sp. N1-5-1-14]|uniref:APC family permease n=1 Tax=Paenibacillus radicibacter TaxID=2972488 RepID=UPI0021593846|nr:APC family permease [Paenibacillus radicibacter]MCR8645009.1 APC family permease [Paenibacillus radicibacter]